MSTKFYSIAYLLSHNADLWFGVLKLFEQYWLRIDPRRHWPAFADTRSILQWSVVCRDRIENGKSRHRTWRCWSKTKSRPRTGLRSHIQFHISVFVGNRRASRESHAAEHFVAHNQRHCAPYGIFRQRRYRQQHGWDLVVSCLKIIAKFGLTLTSRRNSE